MVVGLPESCGESTNHEFSSVDITPPWLSILMHVGGWKVVQRQHSINIITMKCASRPFTCEEQQRRRFGTSIQRQENVRRKGCKRCITGWGGVPAPFSFSSVILCPTQSGRRGGWQQSGVVGASWCQLLPEGSIWGPHCALRSDLGGRSHLTLPLARVGPIHGQKSVLKQCILWRFPVSSLPQVPRVHIIGVVLPNKSVISAP
jgi:hypothetical protein